MKLRKTFYVTFESNRFDLPSEMDREIREADDLLGEVADAFRETGIEVHVSSDPTCPASKRKKKSERRV